MRVAVHACDARDSPTTAAHPMPVPPRTTAPLVAGSWSMRRGALSRTVLEVEVSIISEPPTCIAPASVNWPRSGAVGVHEVAPVSASVAIVYSNQQCSSSADVWPQLASRDAKERPLWLALVGVHGLPVVVVVGDTLKGAEAHLLLGLHLLSAC